METARHGKTVTILPREVSGCHLLQRLEPFSLTTPLNSGWTILSGGMNILLLTESHNWWVLCVFRREGRGKGKKGWRWKLREDKVALVG